MELTPDVQAFIARVDALPPDPGACLDSVLKPSLDEEAELRRLFATDRGNTRLAKLHVGLVDVFEAPSTIRTTRARVVQGKEGLSEKFIMPVPVKARRKEGTPSMVADLEEFKKNWSIFTEGSLSQLLDWENVVAAGGSVLACLTPLDDADKISKRAIRKYYHSQAYTTSDVDIFLWGLTAEQAEDKIKTIYEAVRDSVPWDVTCIRTKHTVSIHSQYPYRSVQIVLRLYYSPAEILAGFDVDAPCCAYDGNRVWANPRAIVAMMRQCNTVDVTRRSPSYEIRLAKYARRNFEVYVPTLNREEVDPTIYERSIARIEGLARLLVLEKLANENMRSLFLAGRRQLRGRPNANNKRNKRRYKGDLKAETDIGLEMNDYDVGSLHIPYGPGWEARRIEKLIYGTDLGMNSTFNPKNKGHRLHRHPAFFGTADECLEDCCENCPKAIAEAEKKLQAEEDLIYVRGRIQFIKENPGRQSISGSFNPIDVGEWSEQTYIKPVHKLFAAIAAHDRYAVKKLLDEGTDVNVRDHVGRTSLHVAILAKATDIACDLIDRGARITARLADGRAALHIAAQSDQVAIIQKLLEKSVENQKQESTFKAKDAVGPQATIKLVSAEDVAGSQHNENTLRLEDRIQPPVDPKEANNQPDIIDVNALDWDFGFSALSYAVLFASGPTLEVLLKAGVDVGLPTKPSDQSRPLHPLTLAILREDEDEACKIATRLLQAGASSSTADSDMRTIFHAAVFSGREKLVETILRVDPHASIVVNSPAFHSQHIIFPVVTAINAKRYGLLAILLLHGAKLNLQEEDIARVLEFLNPHVRDQLTPHSESKGYVHLAYQPVETALQNHDDVAKLLIALGATVDVGLIQSLQRYSISQVRHTVKDFVNYALEDLSGKIDQNDKETAAIRHVPIIPEAPMEEPATAWTTFCEQYTKIKSNPTTTSDLLEAIATQKERQLREARRRLEELKDLFSDVQSLLVTRGAKTWNEVYPSVPSVTGGFGGFNPPMVPVFSTTPQHDVGHKYALLSSPIQEVVAHHLITYYDKLYEACFCGDNSTVQKLCLPAEGEITPGLSVPLNISVKRTGPHGSYGFTPLFAAIAGRRWSTAKLVLAIATAQYRPDNEIDKITFNQHQRVNLYDDASDTESCVSDDGSENAAQHAEVIFVDVATRPSMIQCNIHPKKILQEPGFIPSATPIRVSFGLQSRSAHPLTKAVIDHDLEAFVRVMQLYESLPQPVDFGADVLDTIIQEDQDDILDEYIRRAGVGLDVNRFRHERWMKDGETEVQTATNDQNRFYLGLNVHGKKRLDLARSNDPNHSEGSVEKMEIPLVWQAARGAAKRILSYLASERPLAAYKFYAQTHSEPTAIWFRRMLDSQEISGASRGIEERLSTWLGWTINSLGESPLAAAIISNNVDVVRLIAQLNPDLMTRALTTKIKFIGMNPLLFAVRKQCVPEILDFLLSRNVSVAERDLTQGWNIYHYICDLNDFRLLEYFLHSLPKDLNETLLAQQSTVQLNTPLHISAKKGHKQVVESLVAYSQAASLIRDIDGQTPLHHASQLSYPAITQCLLSASPQAMFMENSAGITPLELAHLAELKNRLKTYSYSDHVSRLAPFPIYPGVVNLEPPRFPIVHGLAGGLAGLGVVQKELKAMREVIEKAAGEFDERNETFDFKGVRDWIEGLEGRLLSLKKKQETLEIQRQHPQGGVPMVFAPLMTQGLTLKGNSMVWGVGEGQDVPGTLARLRDAVALTFASTLTVPARHLVPILDVQKSVTARLAKVADKNSANQYHTPVMQVNRQNQNRRRNGRVGGEGGLAAEEDEEKMRRKQSMVFQSLEPSTNNSPFGFPGLSLAGPSLMPMRAMAQLR
ncbi:hypothetical protein GALMADRAFT_574798 [Galerina marginata CBS 339.88]|uniref:Ankyrin repeat protein n=1 Tax=Galerina marginata (strain CBS 339.88) TaxID=685588 RepID=A0A067STL6_GALM3|nr:hypothetical protein GALMADRAFT_574798 [Galerina marginata CBS 339.88]